MFGRLSHPGMGPCPPRPGVASNWLLRTPDWGFHTVRGGVDPGNHHFRPQFVRAVDVWNDF